MRVRVRVCMRLFVHRLITIEGNFGSENEVG